MSKNKKNPLELERERMSRVIPTHSIKAMLLGSAMAARKAAQDSDRTAIFAKGKDTYLIAWSASKEAVMSDSAEAMEDDSFSYDVEMVEGRDITAAAERLSRAVYKSRPNCRVMAIVHVSRMSHLAIDGSKLTDDQAVSIKAGVLAYRMLREAEGDSSLDSLSDAEVFRLALDDFGEVVIPEEVRGSIRRGVICQGMTVDSRAAVMSLDTTKATDLYDEGLVDTDQRFIDEACEFFIEGDGRTERHDLGCSHLIQPMLTMMPPAGGYDE